MKKVFSKLMALGICMLLINSLMIMSAFATDSEEHPANLVWDSADTVDENVRTDVNLYGTAVGYVMGPATDDYILGDVDENGTVESKDALLILRNVTKVETLSNRQVALADVDGDGDADSSDANSILSYVVNTIDHMPLYD